MKSSNVHKKSESVTLGGQRGREKRAGAHGMIGQRHQQTKMIPPINYLEGKTVTCSFKVEVMIVFDNIFQCHSFLERMRICRVFHPTPRQWL